MTLQRNSRFYLLVTLGLLLLLALVTLFDHLSYDKNRFAQEIETRIQEIESEGVHLLRAGNWIQQVRLLRSENRSLSNDLVQQLEKLSQQSFAIYLYQADTLLFWSKPGPIIDPKHKEYQQIPGVVRDHRQEYFIKKADIVEGQDLLQAYFRIPIVSEDEQEYSIAVTKYKFGTPSPDNATLIRSIDGSPIAYIELLSKEHGFPIQSIFLVLFLLTFWSISITWIKWIQEREEKKLGPVNKTLIQIFGILALRIILLYVPYHEFFDQLTLLSPIIRDIPFPYSTIDLLLDSAIFLCTCILASKLYNREWENKQSDIRSKSPWPNRLMTTGHYLIVILMCGLTAWILRQVVGQSNLRMDLVEISFLDLRYFLSIFACGLIIMGVFTFSFQIVNRAIHYTSNFYERMITLLAAGMLALPLVLIIDFDLPLSGFFLGVFILMTLLDLYIEQGHKTVLWVMGWLIAISSLSALMLFKYQHDFEQVSRADWIENAPFRGDSKEKIEEKSIDWLPTLARKYSMGVYDNGQLVFAHRYDYPVVLPNFRDLKQGTFYALSTGKERLDIGMRDKYDRVILIGKKKEGINQVLSLFSLVFTIFSFLLFLLAGLNAVFKFLPGNMELTISPKPSLRNKIQIAVVMIILLTFGLVGLLAVYYLRTNSRADELRRYDERLRTIANSIKQAIPTDESRTWRSDMRLASRIAVAQNVTHQIFDPSGDMIQGQESGSPDRLPVKMSFLPKLILDAGSRDYYLNTTSEDQRATQSVDVGYVTIHEPSGTSGYIELTELLPKSGEGGDPGSAFVMTLLNAYVFIFLLAITMALFMSRSITKPVVQLSEKLKKIRLGKKNETISWNIDDEIGELIRDYNAMVGKLDESAAMLAQSERDLAWREMAKQVAHEIKNPLTPMKLSIQYLQGAASRDEEQDLSPLISRVSRTLIEQIDNLNNIASAFSNYAKMPQAQNEVFVLNDVVASVHDLFRKREDMDVQLQVPITDLYVFADKSQMIRVLNNIVKNAIQAIPQTRRGLISIKLSEKENNILLTISDNGIGIEESMRDKVFYPNFTTKSSGMGLGLAICSDIIQSFDGKIYFETEKGVGTTFFIELPRHIPISDLHKENTIEISDPIN